MQPSARRTKRARIFISHSSTDGRFANLLARKLRRSSFEPWIYKEQVLAGDDILERLGQGLTSMDVLVFLISEQSLRSSWVDREVKFAQHAEITDKRILILPLAIDDVPVERVPWFLRDRNIRRIPATLAGTRTAVSEIRKFLQRRLSVTVLASSAKKKLPTSDLRLEALVKTVRLADWEAAARAALTILQATDASGRNELFEELLDYQDLSDEDDRLWGALHMIESVATLAPSLMTHAQLDRMAHNPNFSVRSAAASVCLRLAQFAPAIVPVNLLVRLSAHDEDWYVEAPANAALQTLVRPIPEVIQIFYNRLKSTNSEEREHASLRILGIANEEPELLQRDHLEQALSEIKKRGDDNAAQNLLKALELVKRVRIKSRFRYGI